MGARCPRPEDSNIDTHPVIIIEVFPMSVVCAGRADILCEIIYTRSSSHLFQALRSSPERIPSTSPSTASPSLHPFHSPRPARCLIVGLPCGQFHGFSISPMCLTTCSICFMVNTLPTMILLRQARIASIRWTFFGRGMTELDVGVSDRR